MEAHCNLGASLQSLNRLDEAANCYLKALELDPAHEDSRFNLGTVLHALGNPTEAANCYRQMLKANSSSVEAWYNLGNALRDCDKLDEAIACFANAVKLKPDYAKAYNNLGTLLHYQREFEQAVDQYRQALQFHLHFATAHLNLANALRDLRRFDEAEACYRRAIEIDPNLGEARVDQATLRLLQRDFDGWNTLEWRWKIGVQPVRPCSEPRWTGESLNGKTILLYTEQGLGDVLQFVRFARLIKERGATVVVECPRALTKLLASCPGIDHLVAAGERQPPVDVQCPLFSVPGVADDGRYYPGERALFVR